MPSDQNLPPLIFANSLEVHGTLNGICNLLLAAARFVPDGTEGKVAVEKTFVADLRFDLFLAQQLRDALDKILADQTKPAPPKMDS